MLQLHPYNLGGRSVMPLTPTQYKDILWDKLDQELKKLGYKSGDQVPFSHAFLGDFKYTIGGSVTSLKVKK